jgi:hypothetical protein
MTWGPFNGNVNNRATSNEALRARGYITADVRNQTEYGTVRAYIAVGINTNDVGLQVTSLVANDPTNRKVRRKWGDEGPRKRNGFLPTGSGVRSVTRNWRWREVPAVKFHP